VTASFDHREPGTSEQEWQQALDRRFPLLSPPGHDDRLLVIAAHPDDETLGAGGLIAAAARAGAVTTVLIATDGEASHPRSSTHGPKELSTIRRHELTAAVTRLDPQAEVRFLGRFDGSLGENVSGLVADLVPEVRWCTHVISPWRGDRHPDHAACAEAAATAILAVDAEIQHWQYPIWAWHWAQPNDDDVPWTAARSLPLAPSDLRAKLDALNCHTSQHSALSAAPGDEPILTPEMLAHFSRDHETFFVEALHSPASYTAYFDGLYAGSADPWGLGDRFYESRKRGIIMASLPRARFERAFEPGCGTGQLTGLLAERCDHVVAWDTAQAAVEQTRHRVTGSSGVAVSRGRIPFDWPEGSFDLIVLSEVGYYCPDLTALWGRIDRSLSADGVLLACHWRHAAPDHPHTAESVHEALGHGRHGVLHHVELDFRLDVWTRSGRSVAERDGIIP
jgi:LmbE family N-acetylglucosaminyl deacetylase